ncbi:MAG: 4a-hydroxytetrahydrobiopterin dehydratase [Calditrichaeota bacterium]|nr:MAG: 4a-hydroxytetrahydrobiopterin dehydratase [Calditrichota bacterium]
MKLSEKKCIPCEGKVPRLSQDEIGKFRSELKNEWQVLEGRKISCEFKFKNFVEAMKFANKITEIAEGEDHHPDLHISWGKVVVEIWTHSIDGLSENDFILSSKIEELV